jgi:probable HAF family extracellular repeat protein
MRAIGTLGGISSYANDINDSGQIVGWSYTNLTTAPISHAFVTGENGMGIFDLNLFAQTGRGTQFETAGSINNKGQILAAGGGRSYLLTPTTVVSRIATVGVECSGLNLTNGLVAYYPFNGNANDESGNARHGSIVGAKFGQDRFGNSGKCLMFNGKTDYVLIRDRFPDLTGLTLSAWVKYESGSAFGRGDVFSDSTTDGGNDFQLAVLSDKKIGVVANKGGAFLAREIELPNSILGNWTHIVWTMTGFQQVLYINGVVVMVLNG